MPNNTANTHQMAGNSLEPDSRPQLIVTETGEPFEVPEEGNLGLLALGYVGIMLWREKKHAIQAAKKENNTDGE